VVLRDGMVLEKPSKGNGKGKGKGKGGDGPKTEKWLPVACHPVTHSLLDEFKVAFDSAIQLAATCATEPICFQGAGPVICWMDLSNPPLDTVGANVEVEPPFVAETPNKTKRVVVEGESSDYIAMQPCLLRVSIVLGRSLMNPLIW